MLILLSHVFADSSRVWICYFSDSAEWRRAAKMGHETHSSGACFAEYADSLATVLGRADRAQPFKDYCTGLLISGERKSVEPMAAVVAPARVSAKHQSLLHLVAQAAWRGEALLGKVRELVLPAIEAQGQDRGLDCRRHGLRKEGRALGRRGAAILRAARQDRQLSNRGDAVDRQSRREPADRPSSLPDGRLGGGRSAAQEGPCPGQRDLQDQAADRARSDQSCACSRRLARGVAFRCRLRR